MFGGERYGKRTPSEREQRVIELRDSRTGKSQTKSELQSTSSKTIFESSTTSSDSGTESNSPCGTKPANMEPQPTPDVLESWEHRILDLDQSDTGTDLIE